jgi:transcriptional regulator with XRE-family HTH domain
VATRRDRSGENLGIALQRVRAARKAAGLSQTEMGERLGMSRAGYGHLESGTNLMTVEDLFRIAAVLGLPVEHLLGLDTELGEDEGRILALYRRARAAGLGGLALRQLAALVAEDTPVRSQNVR